uniref:Uncharacterized protein n=1 Tax=Arundo donax TaxID=35708 RepID=A0A0A9BB09_ARUDO
MGSRAAMLCMRRTSWCRRRRILLL